MLPLSGHSPERRKEGKNRDKRVREEEGEVGTSYLCISPLACSSLCPQAEREPMLQADVFLSHPKAAAHHPILGGCPWSGSQSTTPPGPSVP